AHGLQPVDHACNIVLNAGHVRLLVAQEIPLLDQLLAVGRIAHLVFKALRVHIHLHVLPQQIQLHIYTLPRRSIFQPKIATVPGSACASALRPTRSVGPSPASSTQSPDWAASSAS